MKRLFQHIILFIVFGGFMLPVITGCRGNHNHEVVITLNNPGDEVFPFDDYFQVDRIVNVSAQGEFTPLSGLIKYVHIANGYSFIWDYDNLTISKIDLNTGVIVSQMPTGRDYNIMKGDDEHLYLLGRKNKMHVLDFNFKEQDTVSFKFIPALSSFAKTKDGFIFLNTYNNKRKGRIIMTDEKCSKATSFIKSSKEESPQLFSVQGGTPKEIPGAYAIMIYPGDLFMPYSNGMIFCFDPENNKAYLSDGKKMRKLFRIDTDSYNWKDRAPYVIQINSIKDNKLIIYNYDMNYYLAYYDKKYNLIAHGKYHPSYGILTTPLWQYPEDGLLSVDVPDEEAVQEDSGKPSRTRIVFYRPK